MSIFRNFYFTLLFVAILIFAFADAVNSVLMLRKIEADYPKFSIYFRGVFEFVILAWLFFHHKITAKNLRIIGYCCFLLASSTFAYLILLSKGVGNFLVFFSLLNKELFFFICFIFIYKSFDNMNTIQKGYVFKSYELIIYVNSFCAILGLIFNIPLFATYYNGRFGYIGFIPAVNEASLFWLIALFYSLYVYKTEQKKLPLLFSVIACCLLGSKAAWICIFISITWFFYKFYPKTGRKIIIFFMLSAPIFVSIYFEKISEYLKSLEVLSYFVYRLDKLDALTIFLSGRNEYISSFFYNLSFWSLPNYLFGGILTIGSNHITTEMDIFDTIMVFGFIGTIFYLLVYKKIFAKIHNSYKIIFSFLFFSMAATGGHVFWSALNAVYLCLFICKTKEINFHARHLNYSSNI